jgi:hypothetical protein
MKALQCSEIRKMIACILSLSIDEIRAAKDNQFFYEFDVPPTDDEVDEFIVSSSCFDDEMKEWLLSEVGIVLVEE